MFNEIGEMPPQNKQIGSVHYRKQILEANYSRSQPSAILVDDGAPPHTAKRTTEWWATYVGSESVEAPLRQYHSSFDEKKVLPKWPADSPDLNPIENLWRKIKIEKNKRNPSTNVSQIKAVCEEYLESESCVGYCQLLHASFKKKVRALHSERR